MKFDRILPFSNFFFRLIRRVSRRYVEPVWNAMKIDRQTGYVPCPRESRRFWKIALNRKRCYHGFIRLPSTIRSPIEIEQTIPSDVSRNNFSARSQRCLFTINGVTNFTQRKRLKFLIFILRHEIFEKRKLKIYKRIFQRLLQERNVTFYTTIVRRSE